MNKQLFDLSESKLTWWSNPQHSQENIQAMINCSDIVEVDMLDRGGITVYKNDELNFIVVQKPITKPFRPGERIKDIVSEITTNKALHKYIDGQEPVYVKGVISRMACKHIEVVFVFKR